MSFGAPYWLFALALVPVLIVIFFANERRRRVLLEKIVAARLQAELAGSVSLAKRRARFFILLAGLACVIVSLAQPRYGYTWEQSKRKGRDVIIAIDTSKSMLSNDVMPNRLTRAKMAAQDLVGMLQGDRVGLIAFAGTSFLQAPLTIDYGAVVNSINELDTNIIPRGGTDIASAIQCAAEAFGKGESENRCLVLITDGEDLGKAGVEAARREKDHFRIFTVGVGSTDGSIIPVPEEQGGTAFVKDPNGEFVKSRLDEACLQQIAEETGGFYVHLDNGLTTMKRIVTEGFGKVQERDIDARQSRRPIERYQWPLGLGLALLAASLLISERKRNGHIMNVPRRSVAVVALLLFALSSTSHAEWNWEFWKPKNKDWNPGVEKYQKGLLEENKTPEQAKQSYKDAYKVFSEQQKKQPNSPVENFNLGTAAYKISDNIAGDNEALNAFSKATLTSDPKLAVDAERNIGHTLFRRGQKYLKENDRAATLKDWHGAVDHYDSALKIEPDNKEIKGNKQYVLNEIKKLEQEPPKQDQNKQDQNKQDQNKQDQNKQDQNKQDQNKQDQNKQDQNKQDQNKQDQNKQDQNKQDQNKQDQNKQDQGKQDENQQQQKEQQQPGNDSKQNQAQGSPTPRPEQPDKKLTGDIKEQNPQKDQKPGEQAAEEVPAQPGEMTESQARALVESLKDEEQRVDLNERKGATPVLKDW
jgi:Ca-activated chloride channel family protein